MATVMFYVLCCPVNGYVCFVCCRFDSVCELFGETIRNMFGCILLSNVMELLSVVGGALLDMPCVVFHRMCVCVVPVVPVSIEMLLPYVLCVFLMSEVISLFRSLRAG